MGETGRALGSGPTHTPVKQPTLLSRGLLDGGNLARHLWEDHLAQTLGEPQTWSTRCWVWGAGLELRLTHTQRFREEGEGEKGLQTLGQVP